MDDREIRAQEIKNKFDALKNHKDTEEEQDLIHAVDETRITLVDDQDDEYEYMILDEFVVNGKTYLALASCDEKEEKGSGDPGEWDDITIVRKYSEGGQVSFGAVTDDRELLDAARVFEDKFGHLLDGNMPL